MFVIIKYLKKLKNNFRLKLIQRQNRFLYKKLCKFYRNTSDSGIIEALAFLKDNDLQMIPYNFAKSFDTINKKVQVDEISGNPYVVLDDNKVYFPKSMSSDEIISSVREALIEQHEDSPHKYLPHNFSFTNINNAVLIGASNGIFAISIINKVNNKLYLFEPDPIWIEPLKLTFKKWHERVEIVTKYTSDKTGGDYVSLDSYFSFDDINYIQADVEGFELKLLRGAKRILTNSKNLKLSICCYHKNNHQRKISKLLYKSGFRVNFTNRYVLLSHTLLSKPYFRKCVLLAKKD